MHAAKFSPGVRLSAIDVAVLFIGAVGTPVLWTFTWWWGFVLAFVVAHFFLFCNVLRASRTLELTWSGVFVALAMGTIALEIPGWVATALISLAMTSVVALIEMRKPSYHGIGWQKVNPGLPAWWEAQIAASSVTNDSEVSEKR